MSAEVDSAPGVPGAPSPSLRERLRARFRPPRRAIPTRAGVLVLFSPVVLGIAAVTASNNLLFMLLAASLGAIVLSGILSERNIRGVKASLRTVGPAYAGEPARLEVRYRRHPALGDAFALQVRELVPGVWRPFGRRPAAPEIVDAFLPVLEAGQGRATCARIFTRRGPARVATCELITRFPFGLLYKCRDVPVELDVLVRPRRVSVPRSLEDPRQSAGEGDHAERRGVGFEIHGLRERQDWDELRRVHALRSLALGREVVLETSEPERPTAWLGVAATPSADPEALERALEVASAVLTAWEGQGYAVGLALPEATYLPGELSLDGLLDALAALEPGAVEPRDARRWPGLWLVPRGAEAPANGALVVDVDPQGGLQERGAS